MWISGKHSCVLCVCACVRACVCVCFNLKLNRILFFTGQVLVLSSSVTGYIFIKESLIVVELLLWMKCYNCSSYFTFVVCSVEKRQKMWRRQIMWFDSNLLCPCEHHGLNDNKYTLALTLLSYFKCVKNCFRSSLSVKLCACEYFINIYFYMF